MQINEEICLSSTATDLDMQGRMASRITGILESSIRNVDQDG